MGLRCLFTFAVLLCLFSGCDKEGVANYFLKGAKPGWNESSVKNYIACEPAPSKKCQCIVEKITGKYTPEQVKEKSPLVAADILSAQTQCGDSLVAKQPVSIEKPKPGTGMNCPAGGGPC